MATITKKYNSINDITAQYLRNTQNTLEILTKIDQALNSNDTYVTAKTVDAGGAETNSQIPTIGYFNQKLLQLAKMVKILSGVDGNPAAIQIGENSFKRIVIADLNLEPKPVPALSPVSVFKADPNHFFDSMLNPKISVELDLTDKISPDTRLIECKRFLVEFEKILTILPNGDEQLELTTLGALRKAEFETKYKGKSNIDMVEFVTWLDTQGLVNRVDETLLDQDYFKVEPNRLQVKGLFTVLSTDIDTINKKLWYVLDTLTYYDISDLSNAPKPVQLKVGDFVNVNPNDANVKSTTVYKVIEISTITSELRVRFETVYGEEPIPVRLAALSIYSDVVKKRTVKVSVGYDEYCVAFIRQIDTNNNLVGLDWSPGVGFWTSELRLDNSNGELFSDYYIKTVYDYGVVLDDLVAKKIPNYYGIKPAAPVLVPDNFKVVQINAHLTQTVEAEAIRDLHNQKNNITSEILQLQTALEKQNKVIQTTKFNSTADRKRADDELTLITNKLANKNQTKFSVIQDILASKKNLNKLSPVYHARGFFAMVPASDSTKTAPQEVVQYEIWYRKLSKSGAENEILTVTDIDNSAVRSSSSLNTTVQDNVSQPKTVNGAFSNWVKYKTDARKRIQDPNTGDWKWQIEDVSDANTPNINQVDISIQPGERIELKIKSLSEVGWPETPTESDFSASIFIDFPDDLNSVLNEDEFILKEAQADDLKVNFERDLEARGLNVHLNSAIRDGDIYYAHRAEAIGSGFKDSNGKIINLYDQLLSMVNKLSALEELVNRAKGVMEIYLSDNNNRIRLFNGNNLTFNLNLEDYLSNTQIGVLGAGVDSTSRTYKNEVIVINQYTLIVKNAADSAQLGLLSYRGYGDAAGITPLRMAYDGNYTNGINRGIQPLWIQPDSTMMLTSATVDENNAGALTVTQTPKYRATQKNNQWIWLIVKDLSGKYIYDSDQGQNNTTNVSPGNQSTNNDFWQNTGAGAIINNGSRVHNTLIKRDFNLGFLTGTTQTIPALTNNITTVLDELNWSVSEQYNVENSARGYMGSTIHPAIAGFNDIVDNSTQLVKYIKAGETNIISFPLYIFIKPFTGTLVDISGTLFNDIQYVSSGGDMPDVSTAVSGTTAAFQTVNTTTDLRLKVQFLANGSINKVKVGDRLVINTISLTAVQPANNKILTITNITGNIVTTDFRLSSAVGSGANFVQDVTAVVVQVHKKFKRSSGTYPTGNGLPVAVASDFTGDGKELDVYNVMGQIGGDNRLVENYVEVRTTTATPTPAKHTKKLRFYLEEETSARPFEFQFNWNLTQYKPIQIQYSAVNQGGGNQSLQNTA